MNLMSGNLAYPGVVGEYKLLLSSSLLLIDLAYSVASLGLVSPGAATDGVTLFFLKKKLTTFF